MPPSELQLDLTIVAGRFVISRYPADSPPPAWVDGAAGFVSITATPEELSIVCAEGLVPGAATRSGPWAALRVRGPLDHASVGVLASIAVPLAEAGIPIFALSTYDTDYVLVPSDRLDAARATLGASGHRLIDS